MDSGDQNSRNNKPLIPPLPRDPRGSLEVFNPAKSSPSAASRPSNPVFKAAPSWQQSWSSNPEPEPEWNLSSKSGRATNAEGITSWMALKEPTPPTAPPPPSKTIAEIFNDHEAQKSPTKPPVQGAAGNGAAAQRAAEWGLVLKTDEETGKPQGVKVRTSGEEKGNNRRDSGNSVRSSGDQSDDGAGKKT